jgi:hypothetical protein
MLGAGLQTGGSLAGAYMNRPATKEVKESSYNFGYGA